MDAAGLPIRVNTLAPTWAESGVLPGMKELMAKIGVELRKPAPARLYAPSSETLLGCHSRTLILKQSLPRPWRGPRHC